jgi:hypothetical protein
MPSFAQIMAFLRGLPPGLVKVAPALFELAMKVARDYDELDDDAQRAKILHVWLEDMLRIANGLTPEERLQFVTFVSDYLGPRIVAMLRRLTAAGGDAPAP